MTLTPDERNLLAWHTLPCDYTPCSQPIGRRCITASGVRTSPHALRLRALDWWLTGVTSRDAEVAALQQGIDQRDSVISDLTAALRGMTIQRDDLAIDLQAAAAENTGLTEQLARVNADLTLTKAEFAAYVKAHPDEPPPDEVLLQLDLSKIPDGPLTAANAGVAFGQPGKIALDTTWRDFTVGTDPDGRRYLRWTSRRNTEGSSNGISLAIPLKRRVDDATYTADIRFSPGYGFSMGGKLPGLSMTTPGTIGTLAGGGTNPGTKAASNRHMWLGPAAGTWFGHKPLAPAEMTSYVYTDGVTEEERFWGFVPPTGQVFSLRSHDAMNTSVAAADGKLEAWVTSPLGTEPRKVRDDAIKWRTDPACQISHLFWSVFRGGGNDLPQWADNDDTADWIDFFDGLQVTTPAA